MCSISGAASKIKCVNEALQILVDMYKYVCFMYLMHWHLDVVYLSLGVMFPTLSGMDAGYH